MCEALCKVLRLRMDTKMKKKKICQSGPQTNREIDMCRNLKKKKFKYSYQRGKTPCLTLRWRERLPEINILDVRVREEAASVR